MTGHPRSDRTHSVAQRPYSASPCPVSQGGQKQNLNFSRERSCVYQEAVRIPEGRDPPSSAFYHLICPAHGWPGNLKQQVPLGVPLSGRGVPHALPYRRLSRVLYAPSLRAPGSVHSAPSSGWEPQGGRRGTKVISRGGHAANPPPCTLAARLGYISGGACTCRGNMATRLPT